MSVRKRKWLSPKGVQLSAWVCNYTDSEGKRRLRTFRLKKEAAKFETAIKASRLDTELLVIRVAAP